MTAARRVWPVVWCALAAFLVVRATGRPDDRGVILDSLEFGRRLLHGEFVYGPWHSGRNAPERPLHAPFPPSFGLLMAPFALVHAALGLRAARAAWGLLQVAALWGGARALTRLAGGAPPARAHWLWLLLALLGSRFVLRDTHGGGGNLVNVALALGAAASAQAGRSARAGWLLGLSLATKPTQVLLLPVFALLGWWRAAAHALLAVAVAVMLSVLLARGDTAAWSRWGEGSWALATQADVFAVPALGFPEFAWMNQSLRCAVGRWVGTVPAAQVAEVPWGFVQGLGAAPAVAATVRSLLGGTALAALLLAAWRARGTAAARVWVLGAALALSLLLSPISWKAHHVALLPVLWLLLHRAVDGRAQAARWLLALFVPTCAFGDDLLDALRPQLSTTVDSLYLVTAFDLVLFAAALAWAWRRAPAAVGPHGGAA